MHPLRHPRNAALVGIIFIVIGFIYWAFPYFGNFHVDPYPEIERCAPYAITTHAKRTTRGPSGPERVDYVRVAEIMRGVGYSGYLSVEYEDRDDPRQAVPEFVAYLQRVAR